MDIRDAIKTRRSIRAFKKTPIDKRLITKILELGQKAPSGTNTQPWHVYVCTGKKREALSSEVLQLMKHGQGQSYQDFNYYPEQWNQLHKQRRREVGWALYGLLGIKKGDREASRRQSARNFEFFDAPVGLFFTTDKYLGRGSWTDVGLYMQTVMLAAKAYGVDTCPQAAWISYQAPIFKLLQIPSSEVLVSGMSMGYADRSAIENTLVSAREDLANVATFFGFED